MPHADWLITGLEKVILPAQEIHLARSWKHCTNKILKETKVYYAIQCRRKTLPEWDLRILSWRNKLPKCYVSRRTDNAEQNNNKNSYEKVFSGLFYKIRTIKPYNKSLINLVCSVCTGKYCLWFLSHRPRSFVARSVRKTSGNTFPYRPHSVNKSLILPLVLKDTFTRYDLSATIRTLAYAIK